MVINIVGNGLTINAVEKEMLPAMMGHHLMGILEMINFIKENILIPQEIYLKILKIKRDIFNMESYKEREESNL
jgi:hypothetical protein